MTRTERLALEKITKDFQELMAKPIALLIPFTGTREGYVWQNTDEQDITTEYITREEALANRPEGYRHKNDGWQDI